MKIKHTITGGLFAVALAASIGANAAMIKTETAEVKIDVSDINLTSEKGQEVLYNRLETAAKSVCGSTNLRITGSVKQSMSNRACADEALDNAVDAIDNAGVTAIHKAS